MKAPAAADPSVAWQIAPLLGEQADDIVAVVERLVLGLDDKIAELRALLTDRTTNAKVSPAREPPGETIAYMSPREDWGGWIALPHAELSQGGVADIGPGRKPSGIVSPLLPLHGRGVHVVTVMLSEPPPEDSRLRLVVSDYDDAPLAPSVAIEARTTRVGFFVPHMTDALKIQVISEVASQRLRVTIDTARIERIPESGLYQHLRAAATTPVIASLASIPSRVAMLEDAVASLLGQCDRVRVFLNGYDVVPPFLRHPRVEARRSQDWDDLGDAGKFAWLDEVEEPGYRIVADDDLIYPPDFARRMTAALARYQDRAVVGLHGVTLRQPVDDYYGASGRLVQHFETATYVDRTVHVLGTNAVAFHSGHVQPRRAEFLYSNMADIFLATHARAHRVPLVAVAKPGNWVRQNRQFEPFESIFENSSRRSGTRLDTSLVQNYVLARAAPLTVQPTSRAKVLLCLAATRLAALDAAIRSWSATRATDIDWVMLVAAASDDESLRRHVADLAPLCELHCFADPSRRPAERVASMLEVAGGLDAAAVCVASDSIRFPSARWTREVLTALGRWRVRPIHVYRDGAEQPVMSVLDPRLLQADALLRADGDSPLAVLRSVLGIGEDADDGRAASAAACLARFLECERGGAAARHLAIPGHRSTSAVAAAADGIDGLFERRLVINLDRRPDRWKAARAGLSRVGITAERFRGVDGRWPEVAAAYATYDALPLVTVSADVRAVTNELQFYRDYPSQRSRVAYVEARAGRKAIASAGAWGYLLTWRDILEQAIADRVDSLLVLDDDVVFHRAAQDVFAGARAELPDDWLILRLGALQYEWGDDWIVTAGRFLYRSPGCAIGSHAVGLRAEVLPFLLDHVSRMELPFDTGALSAAARTFAERCFIVTPNVAIQRLEDSDIGTSEVQRRMDRAALLDLYRWPTKDYDDRARRASGKPKRNAK